MDYYKVTVTRVSVPYIETLHQGVDRASTIVEYLLPAIEQTNCGNWLRANNVELDYSVDTVSNAYCVDFVVEARLTQRLYQEWVLRFL